MNVRKGNPIKWKSKLTVHTKKKMTIDQLKQSLQSLYAITRQAAIPADAHEQARQSAQTLLEYLEKQPESSAGVLEDNEEVVDADAGGQ